MTHDFRKRHIGLSQAQSEEMVTQMGLDSLEQLMQQVIPESIRRNDPMSLPEAMSEYDFLKHMHEIAGKNEIFTSFIGQGYYQTITPSVIQRNIFENPGWYTQYTPYQAEISQGRLEALLNFQTMVADLTGLSLANASLLDEATAAAEAMSMLFAAANKKRKKNPACKFFVDEQVFAHTIDVLETRAEPMGWEIVKGDWATFEPSNEYFAVLLQYPNAIGELEDFSSFTENCKAEGMLVAAATDLLSLCLFRPPGEWGADVAIGSTQRFGIPMGAGGPHAAFFATTEKYKRLIPGRIIGLSVDQHGRRALRMALQTREQHIKRDRATSNICTAQALLAIMAGMYAVFHGPTGLREIASQIHELTLRLAHSLRSAGIAIDTKTPFDTLFIPMEQEEMSYVRTLAEAQRFNFWYTSEGISISLDETSTEKHIERICAIFSAAKRCDLPLQQEAKKTTQHKALSRTSDFLAHEVFHMFRSETDVMRYIKRLERKDLSLTHSMISLGSCTMKLNAATQLIPLSWPEFSQIHPFAPVEQRQGYIEIISALRDYLVEITGFADCSFQPNSGAQGEYTGLLTIRAYHAQRGDTGRNVALIPESAHGTNPASAVMAGMKVVVVRCDEGGNIDIDDVKEKAAIHADHLAAMMITYPSTHGVFERDIKEICKIVHDHGGLLYMDGANMNAQVGYTSPGYIGADVCHLNLHKTFAIPHGGGGPGMGPICVNEKLAPFLPTHRYHDQLGSGVGAVAAAPYGSPSILLISYAYLRLLGQVGAKEATAYAILNANYLKHKLEEQYSVLYTGPNGFCAHEFIVDLRPYKSLGISAEDVAKRLIDYGFHAPTMSFPVPGTIMIEPTESESKQELDRFIQAMIEIKKEIDQVAAGEWPVEDNPLTQAPHAVQDVSADEWNHPYSREKAAYPLPYLREGYKFWIAVSRVDNAYGDRNLICTCPPIESYEAQDAS